MAFDGQYAAAQLWKLDASPLFRGRYFPLSRMLAEHLMLPMFPPGRMKGWAEHYDRLLDAAMDDETVVRLLAREDIPKQLSDHARVECRPPSRSRSP